MKKTALIAMLLALFSVSTLSFANEGDAGGDAAASHPKKKKGKKKKGKKASAEAPAADAAPAPEAAPADAPPAQ